MKTPILLILLSAAIALSACGDDAEPGTDVDNGGTDGNGDALTWHQTIAPIVADNCAGCHTDGGAAPFALDSPEDWEIYGAIAVNAIDEGRMPPWQPDPTCQEYQYERIMEAEERDLVRDWVGAGTPIGDADSAAPIEVDRGLPFEPNIEAPMGATYTPSFDNADDYRCFILDVDIDEEVFLTGSDVLPGTPLVHHVLVYALEGESAETARRLDEDEDGPGYTCFGGPIPIAGVDEGGGGGGSLDQIADRLSSLGNFPNQIGAWVPGSVPNVSPEGLATRIAAGSSIVMQIHYSAVAGQTVPDSETTYLMQVTTDPPEQVRVSRPVAIRDLDIPAGEASAMHEMSIEYFGADPLRIRGFAAHMHLLGVEQYTDVMRADGSLECGLAIPDWDFNWQQAYTLADGATVDLHQGDELRLTCVFDNSMDNQPTVNGEQIAPRDVEWGDGTLDEMCLLYIDTIEPYTPTLGTECDPDCAASCDADDVGCLMDCAGNDMGCFGCLIEGMTGCGGTSCLLDLFADRECFSQCMFSSIMLGSELSTCLENVCPEPYGNMIECMDEVAGHGRLRGRYPGVRNVASFRGANPRLVCGVNAPRTPP